MIDELVANIAAKNRAARERASARFSALADVTMKGSADDFSNFVREWETDVGGPRGGPLAEVESPQSLGGDAGNAIAAASSG